MAQSESRLTRRLVRYWVFLGISYFLGIGIFFYYSTIHALLSSHSASIGIINPRYLVSGFGQMALIFFTIGIVFFSFDVRARDKRERIFEVLDSRPITNLEMVAGRFLGLFLSSWIPLFILCVLLLILSSLLPLAGSPIGTPIEPVSILGFGTYSAIPSIAFTIALVMFVTLLVRNRVVAALLSIAILASMVWGTTVFPISYSPLTDFLGTGTLRFPTDFESGLAYDGGWFHRIGFLIIALGLVGLATLLFPRLDGGNRRVTVLFSLALVLVGCGSVYVMAFLRLNTFDQLEVWRAAHEQKFDQVIPDISKIEGSVDIDPGDDLHAEIAIEFNAPANATLTSVLFTLNPGFTINRVESGSGEALNYSFSDGLLDIELASPLRAGAATAVAIDYSGKPDALFGYLDSELRVDNILTGNNIILYGSNKIIFNNNLVALLPRNYWLPLAGVDYYRDDTRNKERDYFNLDFEVKVPGDWLVAGPGKRREVGAAESAGSQSFRFAPSNQVTEAPLVASNYRSYKTQIGDIEFEILLHPNHTKNMEVLAPMREELEAWAAERLALVKDSGLVYPFDTFSIVEVPNNLRSYGGGWRMGSTLPQPSMMLLRETGFPTSRFDFNLSVNKTTTADNQVNINPEVKNNRVGVERVVEYFANDLTGGNLYSGLARSIVSSQITATGKEAVALEFLMENLSDLVVGDSRSYFSMYMDYNETAQRSIQPIFNLGFRGDYNITEAAIRDLTGDAKLWNAALDTSLAEIDPKSDPEQIINVLTLKAGALAEAIYDTLGVQTTGSILATLIEEHRSSSYNVDDVRELLAQANPDVAELFDVVMYSKKLPGFAVDHVDFYRLPDSEGGSKRYQMIFGVRNDEPVAGFTQIAWSMPMEGMNFFRSKPFKIDGHSAKEYGVILNEPPTNTIILPYLSLNRGGVYGKIFSPSQTIPEKNLPELRGVRDIAWEPDTDRIVADDLDLNFAVAVMEDGKFKTTVTGDIDNLDYDQGLPPGNAARADEWARVFQVTSYGKYRSTMVRVNSGTGDKKAIYTSAIPQSGLYDLEIHTPNLPTQARGTVNLAIVTKDGREPIKFDNTSTTRGWHLVGQYQLPKGEVKIEVSNETDARVVIVDAFAWSPVGRAASGG